ncbi:MAG: hypothetical protein JJU30_12370 [Alkalimonas sp.]|nr:hypothetical protein [Alkalimonas sp.]
MLEALLRPNISVFSFTDHSGTVFFNRLTGETVGVALTQTELLALTESSAGLSPATADELAVLSGMMELSKPAVQEH